MNSFPPKRNGPNSCVAPSGWFRLCLLLMATTAALSFTPVTATAQDSASEGEQSKSDSEEDDERADSIQDLPTEKKKKLLKLLQSARKDYANGQFEQVVKQMKEAYDIYPDPEFLFRIALSHERTGNKKKAVEYYEKYLEEKPKSQKRGRVQRSLGQLRQELREEREEKEEEKERAQKQKERDAEAADTDTREPTNTLPVVLTSVGGAMTGASVTFAVLNLQAKSSVDSMRSNPQDNSLADYKQKVSEQNLFAGLTIGTGLVAAGALTWAVIEWTKPASGSSRKESDDARAARAGGREVPVELQFRVGPGSIGISGQF